MTDEFIKSRYSLLSDKAIRRYMEAGEIVIDPFDERNLKPNSYDVTLGPYYFREQEPMDESIYNMYSEEHVGRVWGEPQEAKLYSEYQNDGIILENIRPDERIIFIKPGESILAHTNEFIGGRTTVTTKMQARSSTGRNFLEACRCAGTADIGYFNRWTMEITNNSMFYTIPLVCNRRLAQIVFFDTEGTDVLNYNTIGKYQLTDNLDELKQKWSPYDMLPKMYRDYENKN